MLFVSPHPGYQLLGLKQQKIVRDQNTGEHIEVIPGIDALFAHGPCPGWAREMVLSDQRFQEAWNGLPDDADRASYIAVYDTTQEQNMNGWDDATREMVEQKMLAHPDNGRFYKELKPTFQEAGLPWPNYEETHHFQIVKTAEAIGVPLETVLEYETAHKNRQSVVSALQERLGESADELVPA